MNIEKIYLVSIYEYISIFVKQMFFLAKKKGGIFGVGGKITLRKKK